PTGACCLADGSCVIASAADCATASGTYQGDNTACTPNPCPPPIPTGACCRSEGVCELLTEAACADSLGRYLGDASACAPNPCPTYYLKADGSGDFATIQAAIDAASAGAVIELADGRYAGVGNKNLDFLGTALILRSESGDPDSCYVDCELAGRGLYFKSGEDTMTVVLGIGVRNGRLTGTQRGAGVACVGASPKLVDCRIIGNAGGIQGGGLYCENASPVLERTSLTGNASQFGGGIYAKGVSGPRLVGCTLSGNLADVDGGGLFSASLVQIHLQRTILSGNCADGEGDEAYLFSPSSDLALTCSLVDDSGVEGAGGLLHLDGSDYDDPRFCAAQSCVAAPTIAGDYRVRTNSPALAENSVCAAQIGVFGAGCGALPTGACCLPSGGCALQEQAVCLGLGGTYSGDGVPCEIAGCSAGGACCLPTGACIAATPVTCAGSGGDYLGNNTVCAPYPCPAIVVRPDGSGDYATIQDALDACAPGTTIELAAGVFVGPGNRDLDFRGKAITLRSQAATPDLCVIDCQGSGRGAYFATGEGADSRLVGVTIAAGRVTGSGRGAGIACVGSSPHIENCVIVGGRADADGGAIYCLDSAPTLLGCTLAANRSARGGGLFVSGASTPQVERSVVWGNCADVIGDAIYLDGAATQVTLTCTVVDTSEIEGAGSPIYGVEVVVDDPLFCSQPSCGAAPTSDGDFTVSAASVCLPQANGCGQQIGALGEGCQPVPGACCLGDDTCITAVIDACSAEGGQFLGEEVECPPNGCGANSGGVLLVHATPGLQYSLGGEYCGDAVITSCGGGVYEVAGGDTVVFHVVAAFPNDGAPGLSGVSFGIDYDPSAFSLIDGGSCADFELAQTAWPDSGSGTAVTWSVPRTTTLTEVYWFAGVNLNPGSPTRFALIEHPEVGAFFADNQIPANLDPVVCLGTLGFDQPGAWCCVTVGVDDSAGAPLPTAVALHAVTPNPVRDRAVIAFDLPAPSRFELGIYGVDGRRVRLLDAGARPAGSHRVTWDRRGDHDTAVPAGVYWVRLTTDARTEVQKLLIVR
ncbi:MAG: hypothetical protein IT349_17425, partial [Candidatus Eisenbacteria bacterium]|nr:hypothetical protein [Candidatus Eisenbacteria bacterium]